MLKSRVPHKHHKYPKDSLRKEHISKKHHRSRSPLKSSSSSRSTSVKHLSSMKSGHMSKKSSHSSRLRSIASPHRSLTHHTKPESPVSVDRSHSLKGIKYDKRKHISVSPVRRGSSSHRSLSQRSSNETYQNERYDMYSSPPHSPRYISPTRKKVRSEDHYYASRGDSMSPHRGHDILMPSKNHSGRGRVSSVLEHGHHRNPPIPVEQDKHPYDMRNRESISPVMPSSHSKAAASRASYPDKKRYAASPDERYALSKKSYVPSLHERFTSVIASTHSEPHIRYSREDLEKITIDIRRNVRDPSPIPHHVIKQPEVKMVRRSNEGHRPIFDRQEIKKPSRDLREDAYYEHKVPSTSGGYSSVRNENTRAVENYQVTRNQYDYDHNPYTASSNRSLSERWQASDSRKSAVILDQGGREKYQQFNVPNSYSEIRNQTRSGERDYRSERYAAPKNMPSRSDYGDHHLEGSSRSGMMSVAKGSIPVDARQKLSIRRNESQSLRSSHMSKSQYYSEGHSSENIPLSKEMPRWTHRSRSHSREKVDDYRTSYKAWPDKPDHKESTYFERSENTSMYNRSSRRPFRSIRGARGTSYRGLTRGMSSMQTRGSFRGFSSRGRGMSRR